MTEILFPPKDSAKVMPLAESLRRLGADERIAKVGVWRSGTVFVLTKDIIYRKLNLGSYKININLNKTVKGLRRNNRSRNHIIIKRMENAEQECQHPYVSLDGVGCFGNQSSVLRRARTAKDYYGSIMLVLNLLQCTTTMQGSSPFESVRSFTNRIKRRQENESNSGTRSSN